MSDDTSQTLCGAWFFSQVGQDNWMPATVPGCNFTDLMANDCIDDPFFRDNESSLQWIEKEDWHYYRLFDVNSGLLENEEIELVAEGLDTFSEIYINGERLASTDNMFIGYRFACKALLRQGQNRIDIRFHSPINKTIERHTQAGFAYPAENDKSEEKLSVYCRKAPCHFGWDWGPRFVTSGIWRDIYLQPVEPVKIENVYFVMSALEEKRASFAFQVSVASHHDFSGQIRIRCAQAPELNRVEKIRFVDEAEGTRTIELDFLLQDPQLWWPNGLGEPFLYDFCFELVIDHQVVHTTNQKVGLRTIEVVNEKDPYGESFYLVVNGQNVFMKGANYIPDDSFLHRVTKQRHVTLFDACKDANMNMIRVWGGGVYQDDDFYQLADEYGMLVWQDFMFACSLYPADEAFMQNVKKEAEYNIRRLRNHPCLALWCGNNEVDMAIKHWQWPEKFGYSDSLFTRLKADYMRLFDQCLREAVKVHDPARFYLRSSPIGSWESDEDHIGNHHYWGVWHGEEPFSEYQKRVPRFMSEFGFQSFPVKSSIQRFTETEDQTLDSVVMQTHQKHPRGNRLIQQYFDKEYLPPKDFDSLLYLSQVQQSLGLKLAFEAHRKAMPFCMGTLYWQLNDTWPAASWSGIDYYGKWKALHYQAKRSFSSQLLVIEQVQESIQVHLVSDSLNEFDAQLSIVLIDFSGKLVWQNQQLTPVDANSSKQIFSITTKEIGATIDFTEVVLRATLTSESTSRVLAENLFYFAPNYLLALPDADVEVTHKIKEDVLSVTLSAHGLLRQVYVDSPGLSGNFDDNFFDLLPGQLKTISIALTDAELLLLDDIIEQLSWFSLYDSHAQSSGNRQIKYQLKQAE